MIIVRLNNNHLKSGTKGLKTSDVTTKPEYSQDPHYPENLGSIIIHIFIFIFYNYIYLHIIVTKTWAIRRISSSYSPLLFILLRLTKNIFILHYLHLLKIFICALIPIILLWGEREFPFPVIPENNSLKFLFP